MSAFICIVIMNVMFMIHMVVVIIVIIMIMGSMMIVMMIIISTSTIAAAISVTKHITHFLVQVVSSRDQTRGIQE
jgi:hypothetical protein